MVQLLLVQMYDTKALIPRNRIRNVTYGIASSQLGERK